ncbi:MAG: Cell wall-binding protein YocH precursor [Pelotomaculum sp. PtaU1.Bin035]|nr:MAG: Cell wall-binding protein YocH precursor [Pelotomaculum sp. PtaU1.Bin035]
MSWFDNKTLTVLRQRGVFIQWAAMAAIAAILVYSCYAKARKSVVLAVDGKEATAVQTFARTVGGALKAQDIALYEKDEVTPSLETRLQNGMVITVKRAVDLCVTVDGCDIPVRTRSLKVEDVLAEYGINLGPDDEVTPAKDYPVYPGMAITVARVKVETQVNDVAIDYNTEKEYTTRLPSGASRVAREGKEGIEHQTWQVVLKDGKEVNRQLAGREVVEPAVDKLVVIGSGLVVSRGGENIRYSRALDMLASAYSYTGNNTASGVAPHYGVAAVDTSLIPMGSRLYVDGYGYATALDRGSAIKGNRIDLFFGSNGEAMSWGLRRVKVYILD